MAPSEVLSSTSSRRVIELKNLAGRSAFRKKSGRTLIEGPQALREALEYVPEAFIDIYFSPDAANRYPDLVARAKRTSYVHFVESRVLHSLLDQAQGVCAVADVARFFRRANNGDCADELAQRLIATCMRPNSPLLILSETQDPGNMGNMIRIADAAGAHGVIACQGSVDPFSPKVIRMSVGSVFHLPVVAGVQFDDVVEELRSNNVSLLGADGRADVSLFGEDRPWLNHPHAWLMGNEARGLDEKQRAACDSLVSIPLYGRAESLNVATACALCIYESARG